MKDLKHKIMCRDSLFIEKDGKTTRIDIYLVPELVVYISNHIEEIEKWMNDEANMKKISDCMKDFSWFKRYGEAKYFDGNLIDAFIRSWEKDGFIKKSLAHAYWWRGIFVHRLFPFLRNTKIGKIRLYPFKWENPIHKFSKIFNKFIIR